MMVSPASSFCICTQADELSMKDQFGNCMTDLLGKICSTGLCFTSPLLGGSLCYAAAGATDRLLKADFIVFNSL